MITNVVGRHHRNGSRLAKRNARTVDTRTIACVHHSIHPSMNVIALLRQHAAALLLIEKQDRTLGETIMNGRLYGRRCVSAPDVRRVPRSFELPIFPAVKQQEESVAHRVNSLAFASPSIASCAGRIIQPISREHERLAQRPHVGITGIIITIHSKISLR